VLDYGAIVKIFEAKSTSTLNAKHSAMLMKLIKEFRNPEGYLVSFAKEGPAIAKNIKSIPWTSIKDVAMAPSSCRRS
jgi:hypothetical protein